MSCLCFIGRDSGKAGLICGCVLHDWKSGLMLRCFWACSEVLLPEREGVVGSEPHHIYADSKNTNRRSLVRLLHLSSGKCASSCQNLCFLLGWAAFASLNLGVPSPSNSLCRLPRQKDSFGVSPTRLWAPDHVVIPSARTRSWD